MNRLEEDPNRQYLLKIDQVMKIIFNILFPVGLILFYVNYVLLEKTVVSIVILLLPIVAIVGHIMIKRGLGLYSLSLFLIAISVIATIGNALGNGIHETGTITYPIVVIISSLVLQRKGVILTTLLVLGCIALLIFGEQYGWIENKPFPESRLADFIALGGIIIGYLIIIRQISGASKDALKKAKQEISEQIKIAESLKSNLELKERLAKEMHHRVKNNLTFLNSVIGFEMMQYEKGKESLLALQNRIQTIARAHDPLFHSEIYKSVNIKIYFERLISQSSYIGTMGERISFEIKSLHFSHSKALNLGIILNEILALTKNTLNTFHISLVHQATETILKFSSNSKIGLQEDSMEYFMISQLTKNIDSMFLLEENEISIVMPN